MSLDNLPVEWLSVQLKDIGNIYTGKTPSSKDVANFNGDIPFIKPGDLDEGGYICKTATHISTQALAALPNLPMNSIMVTCIGNMGKVGITTEVSATNQQINSIVPFKEFISYKYIYYYCLTLKNWLDKESSATTIAIVNKGRFSEAPIPLPPLAEQQEIVRQLDVMLAQVEQIKARLDAIPAILKKFRQSVLADAVSGKLTEEWRGSVDYTSDESGLEIPNGWELKQIQDIADVKGGKRLPKGEELISENTGYPYIRAGQLKNGTIIATEEARSTQMYLRPEVQKLIKNYIICKDDAYITIVGASIGDAGITPEYFDGANLTENAAKLTNYKMPLIPQFLGFWLRSYYLQHLIKLETKSAAQGKLALTRIKTLPFLNPSIEEQNIIVGKVNYFLNLADRLEQTVQSAQKRVNLLTQSILAKAFSGELTAEWREQHQELITGVNSAEALLAKIQSEREASKPVKNTRKKKEV